MLHPGYRLTTDAERGLVLQPTLRRGWHTRVVIARELCLFEAMPCAGVAWHEVGSFARVQASRLAPYLSTGGSAAVRNRTLMMWFWDEAEIDAALSAQGLEPHNVRKIAEPLMLQLPAQHGEHRLQCAGGTDLLTLSGGAITRSSFTPRSQTIQVPLLGRPWARDRLHLTAHGKAGATGSAVPVQRLFGVASVAAVVACGAYAAYWSGRVVGAERRLAALEQAATQTVDRLGSVAEWRAADKADRQWVDSYRRLGASLQLDALLNALQAPLVANGLAIKELEVRNADTRLLLVSIGPEVDLPATLAALGRVPGIEDVQLRAGADPLQATFSMRAAGFRSLNGMRAEDGK